MMGGGSTYSFLLESLSSEEEKSNREIRSKGGGRQASMIGIALRTERLALFTSLIQPLAVGIFEASRESSRYGRIVYDQVLYEQ